MRPQGNFRFSPGEQDVGVVPLLFRQRADTIDEVEGLLEIGEGEGAGDVVLVDDFPMGPIRELFMNFGELFAL